MYLVTGGRDGNHKSIISTEVMSATGSTWSFVGHLPKAAFGMSGVSVNNQIFVTGAYQVSQKMSISELCYLFANGNFFETPFMYMTGSTLLNQSCNCNSEVKEAILK